MSNKPLVFISHINEEQKLALLFKDLVEKHFLGLIDTFVSSDGESIAMGQKWLNDITAALKRCCVEIVLCSPESVKRPWINFEAGAGWVRDVPVVPLCHSGMIPDSLPTPLNALQAGRASETATMKFVFSVLAKAIGANAPDADFTEFVVGVKAFEEDYTFWKVVNAALRCLDSVSRDIVDSIIKTGATRPIQVQLDEATIAKTIDAVEPLAKWGVLSFEHHLAAVAAH